MSFQTKLLKIQLPNLILVDHRKIVQVNILKELDGILFIESSKSCTRFTPGGFLLRHYGNCNILIFFITQAGCHYCKEYKAV